DCMLKRWDGFTSFLGDGRICLTNNAAERALRYRGADRAAFMATLITTAKLNDVDPQAWLADFLSRIADTPVTRLEDLLPWNWSLLTIAAAKAA
ncbi:transposase domain-containing protein, partial [Mesorhizobium sp. M1322]|uniref:transposase domain-containing protein n=1 Tax=Mesorhizobium sp. M1322 TaxID=2957081 RepID=UPI0033392847